MQLRFQHLLRMGMLGDAQQAGGSTVQPVYRPETDGLPGVFVIFHNKITQRIAVVPRTGVNGDAGGFIENEQIGVFKDDIQGTGSGQHSSAAGHISYHH